MQNHRFVVLTGHLNDYPLSDLVGILRHQRKTGRLLIEYAKGPATFFFQNGELIDARMNELVGLQAICVALAQPEASFNFNPLIQTPRRTIEHSLQRAVSELFGCWDESAVQIEGAAAAPALEGSSSVESTPRAVSGRRSDFLALPPGPAVLIQRRSLLLVAAAVVTVVGLSTVIAVTGGFKNNQSESSSQTSLETAAPEQSVVHSSPVATPARSNRAASERREEKRNRLAEKKEEVVAEAAASQPVKPVDDGPQPIRVVMQIENGRVLKASVANHKPGRDSYEALALRIARQRRYPPNKTGGDTITINVGK